MSFFATIHPLKLMLDNFDPKEKKAIVIFFALLLLGIVYLSTHDLSWEQDRLPSDGSLEELEEQPARKSYDRFL